MRYRWDGFEIDVPARSLAGPEGSIHLEPQVFDLLAFLLGERDRVVAKEEILDAVWGDQFVSESALTTRIKDARRALGDDGRTQKYIRNAHGRGYQFVGEVDAGSRPVATLSGEPEARDVRLALELAVDDEFAFVGRRGEIDRVVEFRRGLRDEGGIVLIAGAPGAGKSRLAVELVERWRRDGARVGAGRCEQQLSSPLQPIRDAFAQLALASPGDVARWCVGLEGPMVALIPSLAVQLPHEAVPVDVYAGVDTLVAVFSRVADDGPCALLVDDLQWSDEPTRGFLARLHRRVGADTTTVCTFRTGRSDLPTDVEGWIRSHARVTASIRLDLEVLDDEAATALAASVLGVDADAAALLETTGGQALFLTESLRDAQLDGSGAATSVAELVASRLERQTGAVQRLVQIGALLGQEFSFDIAARATGLSRADAFAAVDAAIEAELLHETRSPERFRFSHQLVPDAIIAAVSRRQRALLHADCAEALRAASADPVDVAKHLIGSVPVAPVDEAVATAREAAGATITTKQFDRGIRLLQSVLEIDLEPRVRAEILIDIGDALVARGTSGAAVGSYEEAAGLARRNGWPDLLAAAALGHWGRSPFRKPDDQTTIQLLREADEALGPEPTVLKARLRAQRAAFSLFASRLRSRAALVDEALAMAPDAVGHDRMELLESRAVVFSCPDGVDELDAIDPELDDMRVASGTYFADAAAPETRYFMRGMGADMRRVATFDRERQQVQPISEWRDAVLDATFAAFAGDFETARQRCDHGGDIGEPFWGDSTAPLHAMGHLFIDSLSGDWARSAPLLAVLAERAGGSWLVQPTHAWAIAATGDLARAREIVDAFPLRRARFLGEHILGGSGLIALGELALLLDDDDLAVAATTILEPYAGLVLGLPWAPSFAASDTLARLADRRGDRVAAEHARNEAARLYTGLQAPALLDRLG